MGINMGGGLAFIILMFIPVAVVIAVLYFIIKTAVKRAIKELKDEDVL